MANPSVHKGHRERLKGRFLETGLDSFTDVQALELLLFYAIPQKDTNPIAHALLDRFGSLSQVLDAQVEELKQQVAMHQPTSANEDEDADDSIKTYDVILRVKPEKVPQIKSQIIDGQKCLVIPMDENEHAAVNGVNTTV